MGLKKSILITAFLFLSLHFFSQTDSSSPYLKVRLLKAEKKPAGCGLFAWALTQKFEILESSSAILNPKDIILLIEPCPEGLGNSFFIANHFYKVWIKNESDALFKYIVINNYVKEKLPSFWIQKIEVANN